MNSAYKFGTPQEIADAYRVSVRYVRNLACKYKWRRIHYGDHVYYHWDDAGERLAK